MASRDELLANLRQQISSLESLSVSSTVTASHIHGSLDFEEADSFDPAVVDEHDSDDAFKRIERMTVKRFRSEKDIRSRLVQEKYSQTSIDEAVVRAKRCLLIDDERYADILIRSRIRQGKGRSGIEYELASEGIEAESLYGWPSDYFPESEDSELERALRFLDLHPSRSKNPRASAYRKLVQKGYSASVASSASRIWCEQ